MIEKSTSGYNQGSMRLKYSSAKHELEKKFVYWKIFMVCTSMLLLKRGAELYVKLNLPDGIILYIKACSC